MPLFSKTISYSLNSHPSSFVPPFQRLYNHKQVVNWCWMQCCLRTTPVTYLSIHNYHSYHFITLTSVKPLCEGWNVRVVLFYLKNVSISAIKCVLLYKWHRVGFTVFLEAINMLISREVRNSPIAFFMFWLALMNYLQTRTMYIYLQ